ncbi:hypothetical protein BX666DRAFT_731422 [Dichotomocladium elegans]|nr:hypothetical protein BX666DRAFT_731422 [Dichotomocladium elegans]
MSTGTSLKANKELIPYITILNLVGHQEISCRCVAVDPGRRDTMYCVHENVQQASSLNSSGASNSNRTRHAGPKRFRQWKQLRKVQQPDVAFAEHCLFEERSCMLVLDDSPDVSDVLRGVLQLYPDRPRPPRLSLSLETPSVNLFQQTTRY